jgi:hypothetical protein
MRNDAHRDLQVDLSTYLQNVGYLTFTEIQLPGAEDLQSQTWGSGRADVVALKPHQYVRFSLQVYDVKVSRSDFLRDVNGNKWRQYLRVCHRFYFALPSGIVKTAEIPEEAGLIVKGEHGWRTVKGPSPNKPDSLNMAVILALLFRGVDERREARDLRLRLAFAPGGDVERAHKFGHAVSMKLQQEHHELAEPLAHLKEIVEQATGVSLDEPGDVYKLTENLRFALALVKVVGEHQDGLLRVAGYLSALSGRYFYGSQPLQDITQNLQELLQNLPEEVTA